MVLYPLNVACDMMLNHKVHYTLALYSDSIIVMLSAASVCSAILVHAMSMIHAHHVCDMYSIWMIHDL